MKETKSSHVANSLGGRRWLSCAAKCVLMFLVLTSVACTSTPPTYYYTLHSMKSIPDAFSKVSYPYSVGVGPVILPELLIHPGVVNYSNRQEVIVPLYHIWGGLLNEAITRILSSNLSNLLDKEGVWPFPWDNRSRPERQVRIVVEELGGVRGGKVHLHAKWRIVTKNGEVVLSAHRGLYEATTASSSYDDYTLAINETVNQLSVGIVKTLLAEQGVVSK